MPKQKSIFKDHKTGKPKEFDEKEYVITMFNAGDPSSGHAALFVEGLDSAGEISLHRCEIFASSFPDYLSRFMSPTGNPKNSPLFDTMYAAQESVFSAISDEPICYVSFKYYADYPKDFSHHTASSWVVPKAKAEEMLNKIETEDNTLATTTRKMINIIQKGRVPDVTKFYELFKLYGNKSTLMTGTGVNCVNWCERQLGIADVRVTSNSSDPCSARPEDHAKQHSSGPMC